MFDFFKKPLVNDDPVDIAIVVLAVAVRQLNQTLISEAERAKDETLFRNLKEELYFPLIESLYILFCSRVIARLEYVNANLPI